jgi:uncharacterized protein (TIGR03067 family)
MRPLPLLLVGLVGATLGFAPAPIPKENQRDPEVVLKRLQGTWAMPRYEQNGRTMISMGEAYTIKIEKDQWTFFRSQRGGPLTKSTSYSLKLDPKAAPAQIDFVKGKTFSLLGVYELKGDTLKIVFRVNTEGKRDRATDLANPAPNDYLLQLERNP